MGRFLSLINESARHLFLRRLRSSARVAAEARAGMREDIVFFLVSFAAAFIILYGFVI